MLFLGFVVAVRFGSSAVREQVPAAVRTHHAHAAQWVFTGTALAMAVLLVLAVFYPRDRRQTA